MLLSSLFHRARSLVRRDGLGDDDLSFRTRSPEVSRLEGFSDAVFGFALTLLVISSQAPRDIPEMLGLWHAVLPFMASFFLLFQLWRAQFDFFRRFGLEDRATIRFTSVLLMIVLLAVYPVKFIFTFFLDVLPVALLRHDDSMKAMMRISDLPKVFLLYATGAAGVSWVFSRLYRHAASLGATLELSELELFDARFVARRWQAGAVTSTVLAAWCLAMIIVSGYATPRDLAWKVGYVCLYIAALATGITQRRALERLRRARLELTVPVISTAPLMRATSR